MKIIRVGVDLAKNVFQVHGVDQDEKPVWRRKLKRSEWVKALQQVAPAGCEVGMEACGGSHYWARELQKLGHIEPLSLSSRHHWREDLVCLKAPSLIVN